MFTENGMTLVPVDTSGEPAYQTQARRDFHDAWLRQNSGGLAEMMAARNADRGLPARQDGCFCPADGDRSLRYKGDETYRCERCGVDIVRGVGELSTAETGAQLSIFGEVRDG